jgi:hypothetical protein
MGSKVGTATMEGGSTYTFAAFYTNLSWKLLL